MSNLSKRFKKELAGILAVAMIFSSMQISGISKVEATDVVTPVEFGTPVLKIGVLSDVHLSYGYDDSASIQNKVKQYVKAVATLNKMAGDDLDVVMLAGDYTGYGNYEQAKTFSTASAAIMNHINSMEGNDTQFFMTYGNHDTEWTGQMDYAGWESVLRGDGEKGTKLTTQETVNVDTDNDGFANGTLENLDMGSSTSLIYEATVNMTEDKTSGSYGSIRLTIGKGIYNGTEGNLEVAIRPNLDQVVFFYHDHQEGVEKDIAVVGKAIDLNQDIACSIQYNDGKVSFWMNEEAIISDLDLASAGITDVKLEPGFCAQGSAGTISNIQIWGDVYDLLAGVTAATDADGNALVNSGSYKYTKEVNGKTYTFLSVETESYYVGQQSNVFRNDVLEWLDRELAAASEDSYVYVLSHAPIKESGVYGSDSEYDKNAAWGTAKDGVLTNYTITRNFGNDSESYVTSSSIDSVLEKYPQVVYFSGHTHYTNRLESSIMADDYIAINVASVQSEDYYSAVNKYIDSATWNSESKEYGYASVPTSFDGANKDGYALYIEVDEAGNQKIQRVNITDSQIVTEVTLSGTASDGEITNPCSNDVATYPTISAYYTDSVNVTYNSEATAVTYGDAWVMAAPKADKSHLTPFTAEARNNEVEFNEGEFTLNEFKNTTGYGATLNFTFPTAYTSGTAKVIRYELTLYDQDDKVLSTEWILGNWLNNTNGCAEGTDHTTATSLTYSYTYTQEKLNGASEIHATLTAVSEFGATKTLDSTGAVSVDWGIQQPTASKANRNMFDGFTKDRVILSANVSNNSFVESSDAFNSLAYTFDTISIDADKQKHDEIVFAVDKEKYEANSASFSGWNLMRKNAKLMTDLSASDTFVYETDFSISENNGVIYFSFRCPDYSSGNDCSDYSGLLINGYGVELWLNREKIAWSGAFKLADTDTHHLQVVSEPEYVSVWIDNTLVYYQEPYGFDAIGKVETDSKFQANEDGTYLHTNPFTTEKTFYTTLNSKDMIPAIAMYTEGGAKFTISNQALYLYDVQEQLGETDFAADEKNCFDASKVVQSPNAEGELTDVTVGADSIIATEGKDTVDNSPSYLTLPIEANNTDTIVTELEFTPTAMDYDGTEWEAIAGVQIGFRTDDTHDLKLWMRTNESQNMFHIVDTTELRYLQGTDMVNVGQTVQVKIVANNQKAQVYINGNEVLDSNYDVIGTAETYTAEARENFLNNNKPVLKIGMVNGTYEITNISVHNLTTESKITGVTALTEDNNLLATNGKIISDATNLAVNGTNFYAEETGDIYLFGKNNANSPLCSYDSFVLSGLVKSAGGVVKTDVAEYGGKLMSYALEGAELKVYEDDTLVATVDLDYDADDYIRLTTVVSPKGFDLYADGIKVYAYAAVGAADYSVLKYSISDAKLRILDAAVWYNSDDEEYETALSDIIRTYEATLKGYYSDTKAEYDAKVAEIKAGYGTNEDATKYREWLITIEGYIDDILENGRPVNSLVVQPSIPTKFEQMSVDIVDDSTEQQEERLPLFDNALQIESGDAWVVEMDVSCEKATTASHLPRIGLGISEGSGPNVMVQGSSLFNGPSWSQVNTLSASWSAGENWHVKWTVNPGVSLKTTITDLDTYETIVSHEIAWSALQGVTGLTTFSPYLFFANVDCKVSNVCVNTLENANLMTASAKTNETINATSASWCAKHLPLFNLGECDFTVNDTWVIEADIAASNFTHVDEENGSNMRVGLRLIRSYEATVMVQHNSKYGGSCFRLSPSNGETGWAGWGNEWASESTASTNLRNGGEWHFKYIIKPDTANEGHVVIRTEITTLAGEKIQAYEVSTATIGITVKDQDFYPELYVVSGDYEISNLYVGYDLTSDIEALNTASANAEAKKAEANVTHVSIQNIEEAQQEVAPVVATTAAYTKAEINNATNVLNAAVEKAITGSPVIISDENTGTATLYVAAGEEAYVGYLDATYEDATTEGQLYIVGWTDSNGQEVTTWTEGAIPKVIDTKMLMVKYQGELAEGCTDKYRVRFLSSVNNTEDYTRAGLVFSLTDEVKNPDIHTGIVRDTTKVYKNVIADGESMNVKTVYDEYSEYMYGRIINKIPDGQTLYVRGFVELLDGTIVYGVTREIKVDSSMLPSANQ